MKRLKHKGVTVPNRTIYNGDEIIVTLECPSCCASTGRMFAPFERTE